MHFPHAWRTRGISQRFLPPILTFLHGNLGSETDRALGFPVSSPRILPTGGLIRNPLAGRIFCARVGALPSKGGFGSVVRRTLRRSDVVESFAFSLRFFFSANSPSPPPSPSTKVIGKEGVYVCKLNFRILSFDKFLAQEF